MLNTLIILGYIYTAIVFVITTVKDVQVHDRIDKLEKKWRELK